MAKTAALKSRKVVRMFTETGVKSSAVLGGKGASLSEMATSGIPVPPGFTVTTAVARAYAQHGVAPRRLEWQKQNGVREIEKQTGKRFGDADNPLLLSVRSGAPVSMPGMMDTVLNLGLNPQIVVGLGKLLGERFALDCYRRFLSMFGDVVLGVAREKFENILEAEKDWAGVEDDVQLSPGDLQNVVAAFRELIEDETGRVMVDDPHVQLDLAMQAVLRSWNNERACEYRRINRIPNDLGTAINVQAMVFGNRDENSATGVAFSRNCVTGAPGVWGEFLVNAQGEDVVAGTRTALPLPAMEEWNPEIYGQLCAYIKRLEQERSEVVDIEFTVESGTLYLLQVRRAKLTPEAAATVAVHFHWEGRHDKQRAVASLNANDLQVLTASGFEPAALAKAAATRLLGRGLSASPGAAIGRVVTTSAEAVAATARGERVVLVRPDTSPDDLKGMLAAVATVTHQGGATSHAAVVARSLGKPCVVGCASHGFLRVQPGQLVSVDGMSGIVVEGEVSRVHVDRKKEVNIFLRWLEANRMASRVQPRLAFEMFSESVSVSRMINDFYLSDAAARLATGTSLAASAKRLRDRIHVEVGERLAMYLCVAVGGEVRHFDASVSGFNTASHPARAAFDCLRKNFGIEQGGVRGDAQLRAIAKLRTMDRDAHIRFAEAMVEVYKNGRWMSGFGGKKWGVIAEALLDFLKGTLDHSVFADHAFDLQHNGGCVFGKHRMIEAYTERYIVHRMLEVKKHAKTFAQLHSALMAQSATLSPELAVLIERLERLGVVREEAMRG